MYLGITTPKHNRLSKTRRHVRDLAPSVFGLTFDGAEGVTSYVGFVPGDSVIFDLPIIEKAMVPQKDKAENATKEKDATDNITNAREELKFGLTDIFKQQSQASHGVRAVEHVSTIEQQVAFLFGVDLGTFASSATWYPLAGSPKLEAVDEDVPESPSCLVLVSDQELAIGQAVQMMKWCGVKLCHFPDFNHRDSNDAAMVKPLFRLAIEMIGKCATGPFGQGTWRKSVCEAAGMLLTDTCAMQTYVNRK